jgi:hypothetical protein
LLAQKPAELESRLGGYWFARLGIVSLVTGVALLVAHGFDDIPAALKAALGYVASGTLMWCGHRMQRRFVAFGQILFAGGLGVAYFTSYALHHVPSIQLIASPGVGLALLAVNVAAIVAVAQVKRSETVAGVALFLGLHTGMVSEVGQFTLLSSCLLAAGAGFFLVRNRWVVVPLSTMIAVYSTHAGWMLGNPLGSGAGIVHTNDHLATSLGFVGIYFGTFALALAISTRQLSDRARAAFAAINWTATAALASYEFHHHDRSGLEGWFAGLAAASLIGAVVAIRRHGRDRSFHMQLALAASSTTLAVWVMVDGRLLGILWCGIAAVFGGLATRLSSRPLSRVASVVTYLALAHYVAGGADDPWLAAALTVSLFAQERLLATTADRMFDGWHRTERWVAPAAIVAVLFAAATTILSSASITVVWVGCATALFAVGMALRAVNYRLAALGGFALAFLRVFLIDRARRLEVAGPSTNGVARPELLDPSR